MQRYPVTVCRNCGTQYNSRAYEFCPGYQCFEPTPDWDASQAPSREFRTGPVIAVPEAAQGQSNVYGNDDNKPVDDDDDEE